MRRVLLYGILFLHVVILFPGAILPVNKYKLMDPDTITPPDPDTVLLVYLMIALFAVSVAGIVALAWRSGKVERNVVFGIVGLTVLAAIVARIFGS
jgi:hypothetical protein